MKLLFNLIGGACWTIEVDGQFKIGCDPVLAAQNTKYDFGFFKSTRITVPVYDKDTFENTRIWILTHGHDDHIDNEGVDRIQDDSYVICNKNCHQYLKDRKDMEISYIKWYEQRTIEIGNYEVVIKAVPALHGSNVISRMLAGKVNGYLITISDKNISKKIYITSDTVFDKRVIASVKGEKIDILIANLGEVKSTMWGGPLTMNIEMLNMFEIELKPNLIIPIHIDEFSHYETNRSELEKEYKVINSGDVVEL